MDKLYFEVSVLNKIFVFFATPFPRLNVFQIRKISLHCAAALKQQLSKLLMTDKTSTEKRYLWLQTHN